MYLFEKKRLKPIQVAEAREVAREYHIQGDSVLHGESYDLERCVDGSKSPVRISWDDWIKVAKIAKPAIVGYSEGAEWNERYFYFRISPNLFLSSPSGSSVVNNWADDLVRYHAVQIFPEPGPEFLWIDYRGSKTFRIKWEGV